MIINCDTERFIDEVIKRGEYRFLFQDLTVVDVGCNIGTFSLWLYPLVKQIHAIDISKENIDNLNSTIEVNKLDKIKTHWYGIAGNTSVRSFVRRGEAGGGGWGLGNSEETIQTYSMADFLKREGINHVDVLKIDTEGSELEILNAPDFPKDKVSWIVGESHGDDLKGTLEGMGYTLIKNDHRRFLARK